MQNSDLFIQGSIATRTAVKPLLKEKFAEDMVYVINDAALS
jgi:hypothetical protein